MQMPKEIDDLMKIDRLLAQAQVFDELARNYVNRGMALTEEAKKLAESYGYKDKR